MNKSSDRPVVALLIETSNYYCRELLHGIRAFMREHDPWIIHLEEHSRGQAPTSWLKGWKGDGIIARLENDQIIRQILLARLPVVNVSAARAVQGFPCVETDDEAIARLAADHFLDRGFKHFGFCGVPGFRWSDRRCHHFSACLRSRGHECEIYGEVRRPGRTEPLHQDFRSLAAWIKGLPKPIGILAAWDGCGVQLLRLCQELGVAVPEKVAVLGVDNDELLCDLAEAPLSSIDPNAFFIGYKAAELLDGMMTGSRKPPEIHRVPPMGIETRVSSDMLSIEDSDVAAAMRFIRQNACSGIKVKEVLRQVPLSRRVLESRFRKIIGRTPHELILSLQLDRARSLLSESDLNLRAIAERSGFNHVEYLSVAFKKKFGVSPSMFRAEMNP